MSFPKKYTRKIVVGGIRYLWHLSQNSLEGRDTHITIAQDTAPKQFLHVDPFAAIFEGLEIRPRAIRRIILWALKNGWHPTRKGPPIFVGYRGDDFFVLPDGIRFTSETGEKR